MKKIALLLTSLIVMCFALIPSTALADTPAQDNSQVENKFTSKYFEDLLFDFIGEGEYSRKDRTLLTIHEKKAAEYIINKLVSFGYSYTLPPVEDDSGSSSPDGELVSANLLDETHNDEIQLQTFFVQAKQMLSSQNVICSYGSGDKKIVIGAHYDNVYSPIPDTNVRSNGSSSVFDGGTGVVILLAIADYLKQTNIVLPYKIEMVFFGSTQVGGFGPREYIEKSGTDQLNSIISYINLSKIGGDNLYIYSDEVKTLQGDYALEKAKQLSLGNVKPFPKNIAIKNTPSSENISYTHKGLQDNHIYFMDRKVPVINILGGYYNGLIMGNTDSKTLPMISGTKNDDLSVIPSLYKDYAKQMKQAFTLVSTLVQDSEFVNVCSKSRENRTDYSFWMNRQAGLIVFVVLIVLLMILLVVLVKIFEKKYPLIPKIKRLKIAVFGMEYEHDSEEDVFVDIAHPHSRSPFDGY